MKNTTKVQRTLDLDVEPNKITMIGGAIFSADKKFRYSLERTWNPELPKVLFIMLNPSTADASIDDPTIRRCINFAKAWGYGGIIVENLIPLRATDPKNLFLEDKLFEGVSNQSYIEHSASLCDRIVWAWGNSPTIKKIYAKFPVKLYSQLGNLDMKKLWILDLSKDGTPKHPLYLRKDIQPIPIGMMDWKINVYKSFLKTYEKSYRRK